MIGRRSVLGIAVLCALVFSAFAAANASAEQKAFECTKSATTKQFNDAHCLNKSAPLEYGHKELSGATAITGTNAATASGTTAAAVSKLKGALSGVVTEVQCTGLSGTGQLTNAASSVTGTGVIEYTGCSVTAPAGKGCIIYNTTTATGEAGIIITNPLKGTTVGQAANKVNITPESGTTLAMVPIDKCSIATLNKEFPVTGSLVADVSGATTSTTHEGVTGQNTLKFGGVKAGIEGSLTIKTGSNGVTLT